MKGQHVKDSEVEKKLPGSLMIQKSQLDQRQQLLPAGHLVYEKSKAICLSLLLFNTRG